ncbi:hypothetical protein BJY01DRAFT_255899 [Aspergillus pseudoustus]|uniref:DUF5648 domain-containing protein n=1 Tax=Aspergillus pseudoustus TaxID=1810923 RepID=A0ABR4IG83_9EURO
MHLFALLTAALGVAAATVPTCPTTVTRTTTNTVTVTTTTCPASTPTPVPLYRAYNPTIYDHFYTTNQNEYNNAVQNLGYSAEGIACRLYATQVSGTVPLFRTYSQSATDHFYTRSAEERDRAVQSLGYSDEGIAGYVYPQQQSSVPSLTALYRTYNGQITDHFYTVSAPERDNAVQSLGYSDEGVAGYVFPPQ